MLQHILPFAEAMTPELVVGNGNAVAYRALFEQDIWAQPLCWLQGEEGAGKTLMAHYWQRSRHAIKLELSLDGGDALIPDVDYVIDPLPEGTHYDVPLFHLLTQMQSMQARLLLCSRHFPAAYPTTLRDVSSRLKAAQLLSLEHPDDAMLKAVLMAQCAMRQLRIEGDVLDYIIPRMQRSCSAAAELIAALDTHNLHHKHPITLPVARLVMEKLYGL